MTDKEQIELIRREKELKRMEATFRKANNSYMADECSKEASILTAKIGAVHPS